MRIIFYLYDWPQWNELAGGGVQIPTTGERAYHSVYSVFGGYRHTFDFCMVLLNNAFLMYRGFTKFSFTVLKICFSLFFSVVDQDPGCGAVLTPGSGIRDPE
jgi:hypothetical protein